MEKNRSRNTLAAILSAALMGTAVAPLSSCMAPQQEVVHPVGPTLSYRLDLPSDPDAAMSLRIQCQKILEGRLHSAGAQRATVVLAADDRVEVRVEESFGRERAERLVGAPGHFSANIVASSDYQSAEWKRALRDSEAPSPNPSAPAGPAGLLLLDYPEPDGPGALVVLDGPRHAFDGRYVRSAQPTRDNTGAPALAVQLDTEGAEKMARLTSANIGHRLAMQVDGRVLAAPVIRSRASDSLVISGLSEELSRDLGAILTHGPLPVHGVPVR